MNKKQKLRKINKEAAAEILELKAIINTLFLLRDSCYPANVLLDMANKKTQKIFLNIEKNRCLLRITD